MLTDFEPTTRLGPATVLERNGRLLYLDLGDECRWAEIALAYPYQPADGDVVLAIGHGEKTYVIGVLRGSGRTHLAVPGDLQISAPSGSIELRAARGIRLKSPHVSIMAGKLEVVAKRVFENFAAATRWVRETFQLRVERFRVRARSDYDLKADTI